MSQSLLILMLALTQLLGGSGGSVYVCISNEGTFCCLDAGASSCSCCAKEEASCTESGCRCSRNLFQPISDGVENTEYVACATSLIASNSCDCTHILLMVDELTSISPSITAAGAFDHVPVSTLLPLVYSGISSHVVALPVRAYILPTTPPLALTLLATIVIRC